jgi:DNA-binding NarL/FixJ family response regulator
MNTLASNPAARCVRIVICEEHPIFRDGLRRLLEAVPGHSIVAEVGSAAEALAVVRDLLPDVLLVGAGRSDSFSIEVLGKIASLEGNVRTILLSGATKQHATKEAFGLGVSAVVHNEAAAAVLFATIASVMAGQRQLRPDQVFATEGVQSAGTTSPSLNPFGLTERELEILNAVVQGQTNKAIALQCSISENTVKRHLVHIFDKVGASSRVELALFADHHQLTRWA